MRDVLRRCRFTPYLKGKGPSFSLVTWDAHKRGSDGKDCIGYELRMHENGKTSVLFSGEDFYSSPMHTIDSDAAIETLMNFLTLRPGDTDPEYFEHYTDEQHDYCAQHAESLSMVVMDRFGEEG